MKNSKKWIWALLIIGVILISAVILLTVMFFVNGLSNGLSSSLENETSSGETIISSTTNSIDYELFGNEEKNIREENDTTVIAKINNTNITMKDFMLYKLHSDHNSTLSKSEKLRTDQIFDKIIQSTVVAEDCQRLNITVTTEEALKMYDDNYNTLRQQAEQSIPNPTITYITSDGTTVTTVESGSSINPIKQALEDFEKQLDGLNMSHEEYRNTIGMQTFKKALLISRHFEKVSKINQWSNDNAQIQYEQYVQQLIDRANITKTKQFPK